MKCSTENHPIINRPAIARRSVNDVLSENRRQSPDIGRLSVYNRPTDNRSYAWLRYIAYLTNECQFFLGAWGMNRSAEQTTRFSGDLFVPRYDSFPMNPEKKDTHSLYLQCFQQRRPYLKFSELSYKFEITTVTST